MRNAKRTILIIMLICVVTVPVCSARSRRGKAKPVRMSVLEILDKFAETQEVAVESTTVRKASGK